MNRKHTARSSAVKSTLLSTLVLAAVSAPALHAMAPEVPKINWGKCVTVPDLPPDFPPVNKLAQCAAAQVPLDHSKPNGTKISLALARLPARKPAEKIGTLFVNPGGPPGARAVNLILFEDFFESAILDRFDIVAWDPRGVTSDIIVGSTSSVRCFDNPQERDEFIASLKTELNFPTKKSEQKDFFDDRVKFARACNAPEQVKQFPVIRHASTADTVRDLDLLRQAVGDDELSYLGYGYGSVIASTYANLFPNKVRALVLDGVLNPIRWTSGLQAISSTSEADKVVNRFFQLCDEAKEKCSFWQPGGASKRFAKLEKRLKKSPIIFNGSRYGYDRLVDDALSLTSTDTPNWIVADFNIGDYFVNVEKAASGNRIAAKRFLAMRDVISKQISGELHPARAISKNSDDVQTADAADNQFYTGNFFTALSATYCSDAKFPLNLATISEFGSFIKDVSRFGLASNWWADASTCAKWPVSPDRYTGPWTRKTSNPVLLVSTFFGAFYPYVDAVATDKLLANSRLLSYAGGGSGVYIKRNNNRCMSDPITNYLLTKKLPPKNTVCPAPPNPFLTTPKLPAKV